MSEKRLRIDIAIMKELVNNNTLKIHWIETNNQIADVLTKKGVQSYSILQLFEDGIINV